MSVNCSAGMWQFKSETGEIFSNNGKVRRPLATVSGVSFPDKDYKECMSNAAVMSKAAEMYTVLMFINAAIECMYRDVPEIKGRILEYIQMRITSIQDEVEKRAAYRPEGFHDS